MARYNIGIIGGGAAGIMAGIAASEAGEENIAIFERNEECGLKILISGGSRCNLTNEKIDSSYYYGGNRNFIKNVLNSFTNKETIEFFKNLGLKLKTEEEGKIFPASNSSREVLGLLLTKLEFYGVKIINNSRITGVEQTDDEFILFDGKRRFLVKKLIIATGGKSYPQTGSEGDGYKLAENFGHSIITTLPALTPILIEEIELKKLSGISVNAEMNLISEGKVIEKSCGSLLFTRFGLSGPCALNISGEYARLLTAGEPALKINFFPGIAKEKLEENFVGQTKISPVKSASSIFYSLLPDRLTEALFSRAGISGDKKRALITKSERKKIIETISSFKINACGVYGYSKSEATSGGVNLGEINYRTMESKIKEGLYFSGEICDVYGKIGGYNLQWAWSSGYTAGKSAALSLKN